MEVCERAICSWEKEELRSIQTAFKVVSHVPAALGLEAGKIKEINIWRSGSPSHYNIKPVQIWLLPTGQDNKGLLSGSEVTSTGDSGSFSPVGQDLLLSVTKMWN